MHRYLIIAIVLAWFAFLSGCGDGVAPHGEPPLEPSFQPDVKNKPGIGQIHFDRLLSEDLYRSIAKDLHALPLLHLVDDSGELKRMFHLHEVSSDAMTHWLEDRIQVILNPRFSIDGQGNSVEPGVLADNYGTALYQVQVDKKWPSLVPRVARVFGVGEFSIRSPRVGLVRVYPGMLRDCDDELPITQHIVRLGTLFHEGRHSDGNGNTLGLSHIPCPMGHSMAGQYACDTHLNGPYTIGALVMKAALNGCTQCSEYGREMLKVEIADKLSRVIRTSTSAEVDDSPEGVR